MGKEDKQNECLERRKFLKKTLYTTPKLIVLGHLLNTKQAEACDPFLDPDCNGPSAPIGFYDPKILKKLKKNECKIV